MNKELLFGLATVLTVVTAGHPNSARAASAVVTFKEDVFPILKGRCIECHQPGGEGYEKSGLDLTTYAGVMKGTKYGSMIEPGNPDMSNLMLLLDWKASPEINMPHGKKQLSICDRDAIREWIRQGAKNN
jgi:mono/diheme cytochrome c family protein